MPQVGVPEQAMLQLPAQYCEHSLVPLQVELHPLWQTVPQLSMLEHDWLQPSPLQSR
jgi:hypothetical protein